MSGKRGVPGGLSHLDDEGRARMVDVGSKPASRRTAAAEGAVQMSAEAFRLVMERAVEKGDVLAVAELAGVMAAKKTGELVPLCHPLALDVVTVEARLDESLPGVRITASVSLTGRTGVEMEALTAVSVACLTVYDMIKSVDRGMVIDEIRLVSKTGGTRGDWHREGP